MNVGLETFIVIVNEKYAVAVRAATNGGAEHKILDDVYYGIKSCQAFSLEEINCELFKCLMKGCETVSYDELMSKTAEVRKTAKEIKSLEMAIISEKETIKTCNLNIDHYNGRIRRLREDSGFNDFEI